MAGAPGVKTWARAAVFVHAASACAPYYNPGFLPRSGPVVGWTLLRTLPHEQSSFTQGLVYVDDYLFESAGGHHDSRIMKLDSKSGRIVAERRWPGWIAGTLEPPFAEGIASDGVRLVQLSWQNERAMTWSHDLQRARDLAYEGEGWGLCFDGHGYWRSDGSARLHRHRTDTFAEEADRGITVSSRGEPVELLNELECVGDLVLANVWKTPYVVVIRASDGNVVGVLDFTRLVDDVDADGRESVLNGTAWDPERRELYVTGKHWSKLYVVRIDR